MADEPAPAPARRSFYLLGTVALVVAALYLGQKIFIPLFLAVLLTFVLTPLVGHLERRGVRRHAAVLLVVGLAFAGLGSVGWAITSQLTRLAADLPRHKQDVRDRVAQVRGDGGPNVLGAIQDLLEEADRADGEGSPDAPVVRVRPDRPTLLARAQAVAGRFVGVLSGAVAVLILVILLLFHREDVRNRIIRLAGRGRLALTTRALDEAGQRIGSYLLGHSVVNACFGAVAGTGLFLLGIPYAFLWGVLATAFRFVPAIGVWVVAAGAAGLALLGHGPTGALQVVALFLVLELATANVIEPRVWGARTGVAPVPLLLSVMFWTGLWGVVGFVLATPITVCLVVLGKHVRQLAFLAVLLGSRPALAPAARYYQRLLARDRHEAEAIVTEYLATHPVERLFERVLVPALVRVRRGRRSRELGPDDERFILDATTAILESVPIALGPVEEGSPVIRGVAASDRVDEVAVLMLRIAVRAAGIDLRPADGNEALGLSSAIHQEKPVMVVVASLAPGGLTEARYLCRRLRSQFPNLPVVVGRFGSGKSAREAQKALLSAGAAHVFPTVREVAQHVSRMAGAPPAAPDGLIVSAPEEEEPTGVA